MMMFPMEMDGVIYPESDKPLTLKSYTRALFPPPPEEDAIEAFTTLMDDYDEEQPLSLYEEGLSFSP